MSSGACHMDWVFAVSPIALRSVHYKKAVCLETFAVWIQKQDCTSRNLLWTLAPLPRTPEIRERQRKRLQRQKLRTGSALPNPF